MFVCATCCKPSGDCKCSGKRTLLKTVPSEMYSLQQQLAQRDKELAEANELEQFLRTGNANLQTMVENGDNINRDLREENAKLKAALDVADRLITKGYCSCGLNDNQEMELLLYKYREARK